MSYRALNWAWEADLPTSQKFVLVALADMADEHESCFPGQERLARMVGGSVSTVRRAVKSLEESGYLNREPRRGSDGMRTSDRYRLNVNRSICAVDVTGQMEGGHRSNDPHLTGHGEGVTPREPLEEPSDLIGELLEVLWMMWPTSRRSSRKEATKALKTALKATDAPTLIEAVKRHTDVWASWPQSEVQYVPHLPTWLNKERWTAADPQPRGTARLSPVDMGRAAAELLAVENHPHLRALS